MGERFGARNKRLSKAAGLGFVFVWFFFGGLAHFLATNTEMTIVPPWVPYAKIVVIVSGIFEILGALGLLFPKLRGLAGAGLFLLTLAVTPAHFYMLQRPELFPIPYWLLVVRLPLQAALLWLIAITTGARSAFRAMRARL